MSFRGETRSRPSGMIHSFRETPASAKLQVRGFAFSLGSASLTEGKAPLQNTLAKLHGRGRPDFASRVPAVFSNRRKHYRPSDFQIGSRSTIW